MADSRRKRRYITAVAVAGASLAGVAVLLAVYRAGVVGVAAGASAWRPSSITPPSLWSAATGAANAGKAAADGADVAEHPLLTPPPRPGGPLVTCTDRNDIPSVTEVLCVAAPFSATAWAAATAAAGSGGAPAGAPAVACGAWDGSPLGGAKDDCRALAAASAAGRWFPSPPPRTWSLRSTAAALFHAAPPAAGSVGPPSVLLRLGGPDANIAHAAMKLLALHHVLRHPRRYGLPPAPAVVVHLIDGQFAAGATSGASWQGGLLAAVLAATPVGGVTITRHLSDTPATYTAAAVVGGWANRFSIGDHRAPAAAPINALARADHAALYAVLPLPPAVRAAASAVGGGAPTAPPPPLRVVYLTRAQAHRRRFDDASEVRFVATLTAAAAAAGGAVTVVAPQADADLRTQLMPVAGADVVVGFHGAALTTAVIGAWAPAPPGAGAGGDDDARGTLIQLWPYGWHLLLFETVTTGAPVVHAPIELSAHGVDFPGRLKRANATAGGGGGDGEAAYAESPAACCRRDMACFEHYRDAVQVFGRGGDPAVEAVRAAVTAGLERAAAARRRAPPPSGAAVGAERGPAPATRRGQPT